MPNEANTCDTRVDVSNACEQVCQACVESGASLDHVCDYCVIKDILNRINWDD